MRRGEIASGSAADTGRDRISHLRSRPRPCAAVLAAALALAGCSPSVAALRSDLDSAATFDEVVGALRELVVEKGERGRRAVEEFDARRPDFAFDAESSIAVFFDAPSSTLWYERVTVPHRGAWHLEVPSGGVREILFTDTPRGPQFVVRLASGARYPTLLCRLEEGKVAAWVCKEVDAAAVPAGSTAPPEEG